MKQDVQKTSVKQALTREEFKRRLAAHRRRKQELAKRLEQEMRAEFKEQTGKEAVSFEIW